MAEPDTTSNQSLLEERLGTWESTLRHVSNPGYASSEESLRSNVVKVFVRDGSIIFRDHSKDEPLITKLHHIPGRTMHFREASRAQYAQANSLETARVEALTCTKYSGFIWITGSYSFANYIGTYLSDAAPALAAETPVPIN